MVKRERVGTIEAAALLGVQPATWRSYVARGQAPEPDGREDISGSPWWYKSTVTRYRDSRPGQGSRTDLA